MNEDDSDSGEEDSDSSDSDEIDPRKLKTCNGTIEFDIEARKSLALAHRYLGRKKRNLNSTIFGRVRPMTTMRTNEIKLSACFERKRFVNFGRES